MRPNPRAEQRIVRVVLWTLTCITIAILVFIIVFVLRKGIPALSTWAKAAGFFRRSSGRWP
jgi:ABC-type phosphate transport system permease subunit